MLYFSCETVLVFESWKALYCVFFIIKLETKHCRDKEETPHAYLTQMEDDNVHTVMKNSHYGWVSHFSTGKQMPF